MDRKQRVYRNRANMAHEALIEAGYLTGDESPEELTRDLLGELAANFVADVLHLIYGRGLDPAFNPEFFVSDIFNEAATCFRDDGGLRLYR